MSKQRFIAYGVVFTLFILFLMLLVAVPYITFITLGLFFKTLKFTLIFIILFWGVFIIVWWLYKLKRGV